MTDTVSDEIVELAAHVWHKTPEADAMRSTLEAIAPALRAQGMREAAEMADTFDISVKGKFDHLTILQNMDCAISISMGVLAKSILARAEELEKQ